MTQVYSVPWFETTARKNFEKYLQCYAAEPLQCLQLGCFLGDATEWMLRYLPRASVVDIDTFEGSIEHTGFNMAEVELSYRARFAHVQPGRLITITGRTVDVLANRGLLVPESFDFVYVDADHHAASVLMDGLLAWPLLKAGGLMAFDDYTWMPELPRLERPAPGIDHFTDLFQGQYDPVATNSQVWIRKR